MLLRKNVLLAFFFALSFLSCDHLLLDDLSGTSTVDVDGLSFSQVRLYNNFHVVLVPDSMDKITVEAPGNLAKHVEVVASGDTLYIEDHNSRRFFPSYEQPTLYIHFRNLERMYFYGAGNIHTVGTIEQHSFYLFTRVHAGDVFISFEGHRFSLITGLTYNSGSFTLQGKANKANLGLRNACKVDAFAFRVKDLQVLNYSVANSNVLVTEKLRASLRSTGNIYYKGYPSEIIIEEQQSTGELIFVPMEQ